MSDKEKPPDYVGMMKIVTDSSIPPNTAILISPSPMRAGESMESFCKRIIRENKVWYFDLSATEEVETENETMDIDT